METIEGKISEITAEDKTRNYKFTFVDKEARTKLDEENTVNILVLGHHGTMSQIQYMPLLFEAVDVKVNMHLLTTNIEGITTLVDIARYGESQRRDDNVYALPHIFWDSDTKKWKFIDWGTVSPNEMIMSTNWNYIVVEDEPSQNFGHPTQIFKYLQYYLIHSLGAPISKYKICCLVPSVDPADGHNNHFNSHVWPKIIGTEDSGYENQIDFYDLVLPGSIAAITNDNIDMYWAPASTGYSLFAGMPSFLACKVNTLILLRDMGIKKGLCNVCPIVEDENVPSSFNGREDYIIFDEDANLIDVLTSAYIPLRNYTIEDTIELEWQVQRTVNDWVKTWKSYQDSL